MKKTTVLLLISLFYAMALTHSWAGNTSERLYDVIFSISVDEKGKLSAFKVNQVYDRESETKKPIEMEVSTDFIENVRQYIIRKENEALLDPGMSKEFYRSFLYDPARPSSINLNPQAEQAEQKQGADREIADEH